MFIFYKNKFRGLFTLFYTLEPYGISYYALTGTQIKFIFFIFFWKL